MGREKSPCNERKVKGQEMRRTLIADALKAFGGMTDSLGTRPSLCPPAP
jgi:hypothetical protein